MSVPQSSRLAELVELGKVVIEKRDPEALWVSLIRPIAVPVLDDEMRAIEEDLERRARERFTGAGVSPQVLDLPQNAGPRLTASQQRRIAECLSDPKVRQQVAMTMLGHLREGREKRMRQPIQPFPYRPPVGQTKTAVIMDDQSTWEPSSDGDRERNLK